MAAAFAGFVALSQPASAITCGSGGSAATYTLTENDGETCVPGGNPPFNGDLLSLEFPGMTAMDYTFAYKLEGGVVSGDGAITFTDPPTIGDLSGDWTLSGLAEQTVIILKAGNSAAAFLVSDLTGTWTSSKELSNASVWYKGDVNIIPLPASLPLLLAGLAGLGLLTRRRRDA